MAYIVYQTKSAKSVEIWHAKLNFW